MGTESTSSTRASLVSVDPAVASHITSTTQETSTQAHSRTGSSPATRLGTPETAPSRGHARNKSVPLQSAEKKRSASLRRAKNSTEVLRQKSTRATKKPTPLEPIPDTRGGRNFTVGNVGTGGVLYLKPSIHQNAALQTSPPALMPLTAPAHLPTISNDKNFRQLTKPARSDSPSTARSSVSPRRHMTKNNRRPTTETTRLRLGRSQSVSTIDGRRPSFAGSRSKTLKIVINRPGDPARPKASQEIRSEVPKLTLPTLEVPIPHYRIGTPRFSDHGTAMLRHSFARTSATPSDATIQHQQVGKGPPLSNTKAFVRIEASQSLVDPSQDAGSKARPPTSSGSAKTDSTIRDPIRPEIYDDLAGVYDDPAVVRYSQNDQEITAATPVRIIAQISSESFMDYDLVSDFFLTFRSYMSTYTVLDLLLSRLSWAIDRLEDDGRIIRVRTFAALRHWILNYFVDDFIIERKLRVRFCNEINKMYADVASRRGHGTSDLKVLRDLKRCWNGRCSMYWDPEDFALDGEQDEDLQPGGWDEDEEPEISADQIDPPPNPPMKTLSNSSWFETPPSQAVRVQHERQASTGKQESVLSEQSIQAKSCSIPKGFLRQNDGLSSQQRGSHPVPVQLRRENAPANIQVQTLGHRRAAASMDDDREPTPRETSVPATQHLRCGSIIRGSVFGPSGPFVQVVSSPSVSSAARFERNNLQTSSDCRNGSLHSAQSPGVKTIFGSLRKALGGRHGHSHVAIVTVSGPMPVKGAPKLQRTPLPLNMSRSHDELRSRTPALQKGQIRIDMLCAQVAQNYENLFPGARRGKDTTAGQANFTPFVVDPTPTNVKPMLLTPDFRTDRVPSHTTAQSGSILIVNDTGIGIPEISGALQTAMSMESSWQAHAAADAGWQPQNHGLGIDHPQRDSIPPAATQRSSDALGESLAKRSISLPHRNEEEAMQAFEFPKSMFAGQDQSPSTHQTASTTGSSTTLRNRKSRQSSPHPEPSLIATVTSVSMADAGVDDTDEARMPPHALRRKPGGDLRNVENVHDLDHNYHHESLETTTTTSGGSPVHSFLIMEDNAGLPQQVNDSDNKSVSIINTHSSQHLRPSFEAAVAGFTDIPDDDDGGFEATLMKLEGRYEKKSPPLEKHPIDTAERRRSMPEVGYALSQDAAPAPDVPRGYIHQAAQKDLAEEQTLSRKSSIFGLPVASEVGSEDSYNSLPLLRRDPNSQLQGNIIPSPLHLQKGFNRPLDQQRSQEDLTRKEALRQDLERPETPDESAQSFLLDEDENLSDLSSEMSVDIINYTHGMDRSISPLIAAPGTAISGLEIPSHPLTYASVVNLAPPPVEGRDSLLVPDARNGEQLGLTAPSLQSTRMPGGPTHIPFILACDSQVLAQQMTLIEKSALTEIEWFDLVEMRWSNSTPKILDWAEYLAQRNAKGVDVIITRFNLVSRWVRSEIVLTQDIDERAHVIAKYIHVAAHARRLHNYATMVQLTIGLTSTDISRLTKTWERVPAHDRSLLKNMESLVQPIKNFHELRHEIETSDISDGFIPFLGLYVHDLTYNAQKPAMIPGKNGGEPLINFERYRTAAVIVKGLLRLIDASARYNFEPVKGVIERCLWLATLGEESIRGLSKGLEP